MRTQTFFHQHSLPCDADEVIPGQPLPRLMGLQQWLEILNVCRFLELGHITARDAALIFTWSRMVMVKEAKRPCETFKLSWLDFLEAIARLADLVRRR